ncbi:MAG TPA: VOC family protein [Brevundimonas sp.]|jgi:catechol 2,3-dioxygenase-like lactoylglutathione lyase family enzyme|uniref:VOC family protein n=1 Tax=Brevundimonas sp. TaxID=1871086 RepID=UPI002DF364FB|nr:VOC family protein [Brevundimonas sp.]
MIDHLGLDVSDLDRSRRFYEAALAPLGLAVVAEAVNDAGGRVVMFGLGGVPEFVVAEDEAPGVGAHVAFRASGRDQVDAFHAAALAAGGSDNGPPGLRPNYGPDYYAAFVRDPDGMNVEAVCRAPA